MESSEDQVLVVRIFSLGTQCSYTAQSARTAFWPSGVSSPPIRTLSGFFRSLMAVPSAKNSGLDSTWKSKTEARSGQNESWVTRRHQSRPKKNQCGVSFLHTCKFKLGFVLASNIRRMLSAARTGTVLFSVTILYPFEFCTMRRAQASIYFRSAARPLPIP